MQKCECDECVMAILDKRDESDKKEKEKGTMTCVDV